jgi:AraC family transcriptional regulator
MTATSEAYGDRLAKRLRVENAPAIVTRALRNADMAVTEVRCDNPLPKMSGSIQQEDAFLVALQLRDRPRYKFWEDGRVASLCDLRAGESCLYDLKQNPRGLLDKPYHSLAFYLPCAALDAIADEANAPRIRDLSYKPGAGVNDVAISSLGSLLLPALRHPHQANRLFVDHVLLAVGVHIAQTYGGMQPVSRIASGRLAPWQERRAKEIISGNLGGMPLADVARECRLSASHFQRAFRRAVGMPAHKWLLSRRIELAKEKLRDGRSSLADVALACGFSDQSHLTRVFNQLVGISPGAWRKWCSTNSEQGATSSDGQLAV